MHFFANDRSARLLGEALAFIASLWCMSGLAAESSQAYPTKPIRLIVPQAAGGAFDAFIQIITQKMRENWGDTLVMINQPGGNTSIGTEGVAKAIPDGYTLLYTSPTFILLPIVQAVRYDPLKDFAPVATVNKAETVIGANINLPANNLKELIALAKTKPGQISYAISNRGTPTHLAAEQLSMMNGIKMQGVFYKGGGPAMTDVVRGEVNIIFSNPVNLAPPIKAGKLKGLAVSGPARAVSLPDVPTFAESGIPDFNASFWQAILAPAAVPRPIVTKLNAEVNRILNLPDVQEMVTSRGTTPFVSSPEQFGEVLRANIANYTQVIKAANIKMEED